MSKWKVFISITCLRLFAGALGSHYARASLPRGTLALTYRVFSCRSAVKSGPQRTWWVARLLADCVACMGAGSSCYEGPRCLLLLG
jgi:hypothetical protein